jgi:hypothetical protein
MGFRLRTSGTILPEDVRSGKGAADDYPKPELSEVHKSGQQLAAGQTTKS